MHTLRTQFTAACVAGGLLAVATGTAQAYLLSNGHLDTTYQQEIVPGFFLPKPAGWVNAGSRTTTGPYEDEMSSEPWAGPAPTPVTPDDMGVFFKPFTGNLSTGDLATGRLYQDVPGMAGVMYTLSGWAGAEANYSGMIPGTVTRSLMGLSFYDGGGGLIGASILDLQAAGLGMPNGEPFSYRQFSVSGMAPAGTAMVRAEVAMIDAYSNPAGGGQAFVVDDFLLIPEPSSAALAGLGLALLGIFRRRA
jgi:hypothetical protein